jgi:hypothetical protein
MVGGHLVIFPMGMNNGTEGYLFFVIFYSKEPLWGLLKNTKKQVQGPELFFTI